MFRAKKTGVQFCYQTGRLLYLNDLPSPAINSSGNDMMKGGDPDSLQNGGKSDQQAIQFQPEIPSGEHTKAIENGH